MGRDCGCAVYALSDMTRSIFTESVEEKQRRYKVKYGTTVFSVEVEETKSASETVYNKIKKLINNDCEKLILEEKRRLANKNTIV